MIRFTLGKLHGKIAVAIFAFAFFLCVWDSPASLHTPAEAVSHDSVSAPDGLFLSKNDLAFSSLRLYTKIAVAASVFGFFLIALNAFLSANIAAEAAAPLPVSPPEQNDAQQTATFSHSSSSEGLKHEEGGPGENRGAENKTVEDPKEQRSAEKSNEVDVSKEDVSREEGHPSSAEENASGEATDPSNAESEPRNFSSSFEPPLLLCAAEEQSNRCFLYHQLRRTAMRHNVRPVFYNISSRANYYGLSNSNLYGVGWDAGNTSHSNRGRAGAHLPGIRPGAPRDESLMQYQINSNFPWWLTNSAPRPV